MTASVKRIMVVDDDEDIRRLAALSLERVGGYQVVQVASGREAVELAVGDPPDAIVLDLRMPDLDGPATLQLIRERATLGEVPVVFLTASVHRSQRASLESWSISGVLEKPFDPLQLSSQLAALLGWQ